MNARHWLHSYLQLASTVLICVSFTSEFARAQDKTLHNFERSRLTESYFSEGTAVGDINGDQVNDVVYGPYWFAGPDFKTKHEIYAPKPQPMEGYADHFFAWIYDFDSDGNQDVLTVGFPGKPAFVYRNPGKGKFDQAWEKLQVLDSVSNESPQLVDLVGDERPELVCTRDGFFGYATFDSTNPITATFHPISEKIAPVPFGHALGIGDINGDKKQDIIFSGGWFEQPQKVTDGRWLLHPAKLSGAYGGAEMFAYDVDGDNDNDIITSEAAHDFGLSWYEQKKQSDEATFTRHTIMGQHPSDNKYGVLFTELHSVRLADMDGDGLQDIVTGKTYYSHHKQSPLWDAGAVVYWFKLVRSAEGVDWLPFKADGEAGVGRQIVVTDIDKDGLLDIATGGMLGAHVLLHRKTEVDANAWQAAQPKVYSGPKPAPPVTNAKALRGGRVPLDAKTKKATAAIEGESLTVKTTAGAASPQGMSAFQADRWSGTNQLWWTGGKPGDKLTVDLQADKELEAIEAVLTCARDYAIIQLSLDGKPISDPIDLYDPQVVTTGLLSFNVKGVAAGKHQLQIEILGANKDAAKAFMVGIDFLRLRGKDEKFNEAEAGIKPLGNNGQPLNLDFETGTLADWTPTGNAFDGQPIEGDTVSARRSDMRSAHTGRFWIGTFERGADAVTGTLTSAPFKVKHRFASFLVGGGSDKTSRVELIAVGEEKPFYQISGRNNEQLSQVVVDLRRVLDKEMFIRLVDETGKGWGHINFDHFRLHDVRPAELTPASSTLIADEYPHSGLDAEAAAAAMKLPDGFRVTVCAAEPDVKQPIAMALDDRGRTWVAEAYEYPQRAKGDKGRDRILIFEDTNGDGKFDSRKVFAEGLNLVSGLEVGFGGVWVGAAPYLLFIPDRNHDDQPDAEPEILLDGWGFQDTHETLNAFIWGPDGWLYGCHGVFTHSKVGKPGTPDDQRQSINAGVWRYHPVRHEFEIFSHGTSNPWGVDFNQYGDAFVTACVIPHLFHLFEGGRYQRQAGSHFNPNTFDDIKTIADHLHYLGANPHGGNGKSDGAGGGHAHCGAMFYLGGAWPKQYHDVLFMNNIHGQRLNTDILVAEGSGYVGKHGPDFLLSKDMASQIMNFRYGPDGQVTFIDWYDMQACHLKEIEKHDRSNGRIYKVSYGEPSVASAVDLTKKNDLELAELCLDKNDWYVRHARRILQERAAERKIERAAIERLVSIASSHADETRRLRALWARHAIGELTPDLIGTLAKDKSPYVRAWSLRIASQTANYRANNERLRKLVEQSAADSSPIVRLAATSALGHVSPKERWLALDSLASQAGDASDHNLPLMIWYAAEPCADVDPDRALAWALSANNKIPVLREFMLRRIAGAGGEAAIERLIGGLQKADSAELQLTFLSAIRGALAGQRTANKPTAWDSVSQKLLASENAQVQLQATALGVTFRDPIAMKKLREHLANNVLPMSDRQQALDALLAAKDKDLVGPLLVLAKQLSPETATLSEAAIRGLAQYDDPRVPVTLLSVYDNFSASQKRSAIATLCARTSSALALLGAIESNRIPAADLSADLARQLEYLDSQPVKDLLSKVWGQVRSSSAEKTKLIEVYKQLINDTRQPKPDESLGRAMYAKTCQRCHGLYGVGQKVGPDLTGSNRSNLDYLLENIVDPSAVMANEYRQSIFLTDSGQVIAGIVRSETENAITVLTAEAEVVLPKNEIERRQASEKSMMPEDQLNQFGDHEIRSLFAYLRSTRQVPLAATEENATQIFTRRDLSGWTGDANLWSVENGEIVGQTSGLKENEFLVSDLSASDFIFSCEVMLVENKGNSGIQFRSVAREDRSVEGYQADVGAGWWGKLYEEHGRALLWDKSGEQHVKTGWNTYTIEAVGSKITTKINGQTCVDLDDPAGRRSGIFALQLHSGGPTQVRFRNLQLKILSP